MVRQTITSESRYLSGSTRSLGHTGSQSVPHFLQAMSMVWGVHIDTYESVYPESMSSAMSSINLSKGVSV